MSAKHTHCDIGTSWSCSLSYMVEAQVLAIAKAYAERNGMFFEIYFDDRLEQRRVEVITRSVQQMKRFASYLLDHEPYFEFY